MTVQETISQEKLYLKFEDSILRGKGRAWVLAVFEGSPEDGAYSWCSDCVAARPDIRTFLSEYRGPVKVFQFKVGSKSEWDGTENGTSPFKAKTPYLRDLPTAVLFYGKLDVARTLAPRKDDLLYLSRRAEVLESQIKDGSWKPPE